MDIHFDGRVQTIASSTLSLEEACLDADIVIGAVLVVGAKAPKLVSNELVARMKDGSVLVDISVDQGGCFEATASDHPLESDVRRQRLRVLLRCQHARRRTHDIDARVGQRDSALRAGTRSTRMA